MAQANANANANNAQPAAPNIVQGLHGQIDLSAIFTAHRGTGAVLKKYTEYADYFAFSTNNNVQLGSESMELHAFAGYIGGFAMDQFTWTAMSVTNAQFQANNNALPQMNALTRLDEAQIFQQVNPQQNNAVINPERTQASFAYWKNHINGSERRFYSLVGCFQTKAMTEKNLSNYYASKSIELKLDRLVEILRYAAAVLPTMNLQVRMEGKEEAFIIYHTQPTSTPSLLKKMRGELSAFENQLFSNAEIQDMQLCINNPIDARRVDSLSDKVKNHLVAFLTAYKIFPDKYYFGSKHIDQMSPSTFKRLVTLYKRFAEIRNETEGVGVMNLQSVVQRLM